MIQYISVFLVSIAFGLVGTTKAQTQTESPSLTTEVYRDWTLRCEIINADANQKNCEVLQTVLNQSGAVLAQVAFGKSKLPNKFLLVLQLPQGLLLSSTPKIFAEAEEIDLAVPYFSCFQNVCLAQTDIQFEMVDKLANAEDIIVSVTDRSTAPITIKLSPNGLAAAIGKLRSDQ